MPVERIARLVPGDTADNVVEERLDCRERPFCLRIFAAVLIQNIAKIIRVCGWKIRSAKCWNDDDEVMFVGQIAPFVAIAITIAVDAVHDENDAAIGSGRLRLVNVNRQFGPRPSRKKYL